MYAAMMNTALGSLLIKASNTAITQIHFMQDNDPVPELLGNSVTEQCIGELAEYFAGERKTFDIAIQPKGSAFQEKVWKALLQVPYGETRSYGELAQAIEQPKAARAIGMANNRNPIPIIIPCHRIIASDGKLTGYSGGLDNKRYLLALETQQKAK